MEEFGGAVAFVDVVGVSVVESGACPPDVVERLIPPPGTGLDRLRRSSWIFSLLAK